MVAVTDPAGPVAGEIAELMWLMTWLGGAVFVLVMAVLVVGLLRGRQPAVEPGSAETERIESSQTRWIVGGGVVLPVVIVTVVFALTLVTMMAVSREPGGEAVVIEVVGHQWWWEIEYPESGVVTANEIHIPIGRPVELHLRSADVIHSFWVPALGGKLDLLPDKTNTLVLEADEPGEYRGVCAEFCGLQHAKMAFVAVAMTEDDYQSWLQQEKEPAREPSGAMARRGLEIFGEQECGLCHTVAGTGADGDNGPDLTHIASRGTLAAATLPNTPEHLGQWMGDPQRFKEGTQMPAVELSDSDMEALIAYLGSLE